MKSSDAARPAALDWRAGLCAGMRQYDENMAYGIAIIECVAKTTHSLYRINTPPPVSFFTSTVILYKSFCCILSIFLSFFSCFSPVFMPFLRSSSFANPLSFGKSAICLTVNHYHSEGRREAEGRQNGLTTDPWPIRSLLASCRFCKHVL